MEAKHAKDDILAILDKVGVATVATSAGIHLRQRMMHFVADENFNVYLATMKGDPKTIQITSNPSVSLMVFDRGRDTNLASEVEIIGKVTIIRDEEVRNKSLEAISKRSPVVRYLKEMGKYSVLDCIKVAPQTVKYRVFQEVVRGVPPTIIEFPRNKGSVKEIQLLFKKIRSWIRELRVPFLTTSMISILLGTAIAWAESKVFHPGYFLLALLGGLLLHAGTNVLNDYFDHRSGNDDMNKEYVRPFSGGSRMIQLGLLTPLETMVSAFLFFLGGALIGLYLAWLRGIFILYLGIFGFLSGVFYSWPRLNWAGRGFGEILVGINFGVLMTLGAYYIQTRQVDLAPIIASIPVAFLITAVLYINEFPDFHADREVGKKTLVVRLGRKRAISGYIVLVAGSFLSLIVGVIISIIPAEALVALAAVPFFIKAILCIRKYYESSFELSPANAFSVVGHLATGLLLILAYAWVGFGIQGIVYVIALATVLVAFGIYFYHHIEKQKRIFLGLKKAAGE